MKKTLTTAAICFIGTFAFLYFIFSFIKQDFNPANWGQELREQLVIFLTLTTILGVIISKLNDL